MYYYAMPSHDIRVNLATEQYLLEKDFSEPLVLFYIQEPCIIIGRNQNALAEINLPYVKRKGITVTRRLSGGGAVYDDLGNVSFSFVTKGTKENFGNFKEFTEPILKAIHDLGATGAEISGRNDLLIDGKKFSGNAMYKKKGKLFSHGTLMLDVDLDVLPQALHVDPEKIAAKGTKSVRSHVTNLRPYLAPAYQDLTTVAFRDELLKRLFKVDDLATIQERQLQLTAADEAAIAKIVAETYGNEDWVYGEAPQYTIKRRQRFPKVGIVEAHLEVTAGKISQLIFYGDYFSQQEATPLITALIGVPYTQKAIAEALASFTIHEFFNQLSAPELVALLAD